MSDEARAKYARELLTIIWTTKGARFGAYRRLTRLNSWSVRALSCLSGYLIVSSLLLASHALTLSGPGRELANLLIAGLSVLTLALNLIEVSQNYLVRAERLHSCALELAAVHRALELRTLGGKPSEEELEAAVKRYDDVLGRCVENHDDLDYAWFRASHPTDFGISQLAALRTRLSCWFRVYTPYLFLIVVPPILIVLLVHRYGKW